MELPDQRAIGYNHKHMDPRNPYQDIHQSGVTSAQQTYVPVAPVLNLRPVYLMFSTIIVLMLVLSGLMVGLIVTKARVVQVETKTSNSASSNDGRAIAGTSQLSNPNLELVIYQPKQTTTNTTINFAIRNKCTKDCSDSIYVSAYDLLGYSRNAVDSMYLVDQEAGQKYEPIVDENKRVLGSESCSDYLKSGQSTDCFVSFTKVDSGTKVSVVLGTRAPKVDNISVP